MIWETKYIVFLQIINIAAQLTSQQLYKLIHDIYK